MRSTSFALTPDVEMDRLFKAVADPTRRRILGLLSARPRTVSEVVRQFPLAQPTISCHLAVLREADLVRSDRDGQYVIYSLNPHTTPPALLQLIGAPTPRVDRHLLRGRNVVVGGNRGASALSSG